MSDLPVINLLPEKWRGAATMLILLSPYLTRGYSALSAGGGIVGVLRAIWFGTNVEKSLTKKVNELSEAVHSGNTERITKP